MSGTVFDKHRQILKVVNILQTSETSVFRSISWFGYRLLCLQLLSTWDIEKWLEDDTSGYCCSDIGKCLFSCIKYIFHCEVMTILRFTLGHRKLCEFWCELFFQRKPMCLVLYILMSVLSIGFRRQSSCRVSVHFFPFRTDGKRCESLYSPKSIPVGFLFTANFFLFLFCSEFLRLTTANWILEWKHRAGFFPMCRRFSSLKVSLIDSLHYRGYMYWLKVSRRSTPVSSSPLLCVSVFELQSESTASQVCVSGNFCTNGFRAM